MKLLCLISVCGGISITCHLSHSVRLSHTSSSPPYSVTPFDTDLFTALTCRIWYRVFIKYCVFSKILKYIPDSGLSRFPLGVSVCCTQWQVKHQCCSRTGCIRMLASLRSEVGYRDATAYIKNWKHFFFVRGQIFIIYIKDKSVVN